MGVWVWGRAIFAIFFNKITHFYAYFGQNSNFKAITQKLKAFKISLNILNSTQDSLNEVHFFIRTSKF